jgi:hypothetical protein
LAIRLLLVTIGVGVGVGVGIGIGIDSDEVLWLVLTHGVASLPEFVSIATMRSGKALQVAIPSDKSATRRIAGHPGWRSTPTRNRVQSQSSAVDLGQWLCRCLRQCSAGSLAKHAGGGPWRCDGPSAFHRCTVHIQFRIFKSYLLSLDSDSDTDPDPERARFGFQLQNPDC